MSKLEIYRLSSFTVNGSGGNPAGVVLDAEALNEDVMKSIAKKVGFSETAFVMPSSKADFRVRFFTPTDEVDLCGHATIAVFNLLRDQKTIGSGIYTLESKAGILRINVSPKDVYMEQNCPEFSEIISKEEISSCFNNLNRQDIGREKLPVQVVSTGLRDILLPVKDITILNALTPDYKKIIAISKMYNVTGIHAFCLDDSNLSHAECRNFAPLFGIEEEAATGTSNGALACYLHRYHDQDACSFTLKQGFSMGRPSEINVNLELEDGKISAVYVGGKAVFL